MTEYYVEVVAEFFKGYSVGAENVEEARAKAKEIFEYECSSDWYSLVLEAEEM